jgi:hypothetical protein
MMGFVLSSILNVLAWQQFYIEIIEDIFYPEMTIGS